MTTEGEEVVVGADLGEAQHFGPDVGHHFFDRGAWSQVGTRLRLPRFFRRGQRLAIDFAVRIQRQLVERDQGNCSPKCWRRSSAVVGALRCNTT